MKKTDNSDGGYILTASDGYDLAILDESGNAIARVKEVLIPTVGTLNVWTEITEELPQLADSNPDKEEKIAELKAELAKLETN